MDVHITYQDSVKFQAESRGDRILSDQPLDNHGQAFWGAYAGFYGVKYLETRHLDCSGLEVAVTAAKVDHSTRLDTIRALTPFPLRSKPGSRWIKKS